MAKLEDELPPVPPEHTFVLLMKCEGGHEQRLRWSGVSRKWLEMYASLLDGTSPLYKVDPFQDPHTFIGRCAYCGKRFRASVEEDTGADTDGTMQRLR